MAGALTNLSIKDSSGTSRTMRVWDESGAGTGPYSFVHSLRDISVGEYETVAASQTSQVLGGAGAVEDYLSHLLIIPNTTSPGAVTIADGSNSPDIAMTVFAGGASSLSNKVPFIVPLGIKSVTGGWRVTTGADVSVIAVGSFT